MMKNVFYKMRKARGLALLLAVSMLQCPAYANGECTHDWKQTATTATCTADGVKTLKCNLCNEEKTETHAAYGHSWNYNEYVAWDVSTPAGCLTNGQETRKCNLCSATETRTIAAKGHNYVQTAYVEPDCKNNGSVTKECTGCGDQQTSVISNSGITHVYTHVTVPDGCTRYKTTYTCKWCGDTYETFEDHTGGSHTWGVWTTTTSPTCTDDGVETRTCTACGAAETNPLAALGHTWETVSVVNAECGKAGSKTLKCSVCGSEKTESIPSLTHDYQYTETIELQPCGKKNKSVCKYCSDVKFETLSGTAHDWGEWEAVTSATCTENRIEKRVCENGCGETETRIAGMAYGHVFLGSVEVIKAATCTESGEKKTACSNGCGETKTEVIPAGDGSHDFVKDESQSKKATCKETGILFETCKDCSETRETTVAVDPAAHDFDYGEIIENATCEKDGSHATKCIHCGISGTPEPIPALGGTCYFVFDTEDFKAASCSEDGYKTWVCLGCADKKVETVSKETVPHSPADDYVIKEATCKEEGLSATKCSVCGTATENRVVPLASCIWEEVPELKVSATCGKDGYIVLRCKVCKKEVKETIYSGTIPHTWEDQYVKHEPTCQFPGLMITKCSSCGKDSMREIPEEHNYSETGKIPASCFTDGSVEYKCGTCGEIKKEVLKAAGSHSWKHASSQEATCAADGEELYECTVCGETKSEKIKATGKHNWKQVSSALATCDQNGVINYACTTCSKTKSTTLPATGAHAFGEWTVVKAATYDSCGEQTSSCKVCGFILKASIDKLAPEKETEPEQDIAVKETEDTAEQKQEEVPENVMKDAEETETAEVKTEQAFEAETAETVKAVETTEELPVESAEGWCQHVLGENGEYELKYCAEHKIILETEDMLLSVAKTEEEQAKVLKQIQSMMKIEVEFMYDEWIAGTTGEDQKLAVTAKGVFEVNFSTQLATWNKMYGENSVEALTRANELLNNQCVDLCAMVNGLN